MNDADVSGRSTLAGERKNNMKSYLHIKDRLLDDITFEELITTIKRSEKEHDVSAILEVFNKMVESRIHRARLTLLAHFKDIREALN
jgi:hypothetical protein